MLESLLLKSKKLIKTKTYKAKFVKVKRRKYIAKMIILLKCVCI